MFAQKSNELFFFNMVGIFIYLAYFFTEVELIYNVVLISAVHQSDTVLHVYIFLKYSFLL